MPRRTQNTDETPIGDQSGPLDFPGKTSNGPPFWEQGGPLADASLGDFPGTTSDEPPFVEQGGPLDVPSNTDELSIRDRTGLLDLPGTTSEDPRFGEQGGPLA